MKEPSWKPMRRGALYCAPACGRECTWDEYQLAQRKAEAFAKKLGSAWTSNVWENLGWHYRATVMGDGFTGAVYNHGSATAPRYWADFHVGEVQFEAHGRTPRRAVEAAIAKAFKVERATRAMVLV